MIHDGVLALACAILTPNFISVEQAFDRIYPGTIRSIEHTRRIGIVDNKDTEDMVKLKETMTYKQIGEIYGISDDAVYTRIRRHQGRI
jgi:hypothetical protein